MFEQCWPFPTYEQIQIDFAKHGVSPKVYDAAKQFYLCSIKTEQHLFLDFVRNNNSEGEKKFAAFLVRQAMHVALGDFNNGC